MTGPARITIELEPPTERRRRWAARTWIDEPEAPPTAEPTPQAEPAAQSKPTGLADPSWPAGPILHVQALEAREPAVVPAGYEPPAECTCLDGYCDADHANE